MNVTPALTQVLHFIYTSLGSVYLGRDIRTGADVALKIGSADQSTPKLKYKYDMYKNIAGIAGISSVLWYGYEGLYEVIVLEYLGVLLGDSIKEKQFDSEKVFLYVLQMVCLRYL